MKDKLILVTGGAGYIGAVLVPALLVRGYRVRVFDKLIFGDEGLASVADQVEIVQGDVVSFPDDVLDGVDGVVHLAALSNDPTAEYEPAATWQINVDGTRNVGAACLRKGVNRLVFASSCSVYYRNDPFDEMVDELTPVAPTAPYSKSKLASEQLLKEMAGPSFCPVFLRKGTVFGPSPRMRFDLVVNAFAKGAFLDQRLTVFGGGEMWRPLVFIGDVAQAYIRALEAPADRVCGRAFNVLHKNYRILELAHWIKYILRDKGLIDIQVDYRGQDSIRSYKVDGRRFAEVFGYNPPGGIFEAVTTMFDGFERGQFTDFENPAYYNMAWMDFLLSKQERLFCRPRNKGKDRLIRAERGDGTVAG